MNGSSPLAAASALALLLASAPAPAQPRAQPVDLPEGDGREVVQAMCARCHGLNQITGSAGYDAAGWRALFGSMVALPDEQVAAVARYLAAHFPAKGGRRPVLVPGPVEVRIREWTAPTLGQRSRDPLQAPDGAIWWAGRYGSLIGRLDPATGRMREFPLAPDARPHGIALDPSGDVWFTGNGNGTVGRVDAETGEVTVFRTAARDPHTPIFDRAGVLWFTAQGANTIGRLDPATGDLREAPVPTARARPYGIVVDPQGVPWFTLFGTNKLGRIDPATLEIREYDLPSPASRPRRLALDSRGAVWYTDFARGYLGRYDPRTGEAREWPSPSGPESEPYAIAVIDDVVWYNESGMRPDALVRFDPRTESFQSWAIPSGVGIVRHMTVTREGGLLVHQSSTNRIGLVEVRGAGGTR